MRSSRRRNELLSRGSGHMHGGSSPFPMVRWTFFCLLLLAWSARAEQEVVWEPARVLDAEQIAVSGAFVPLAIPTFFDNFRYPFLQDDESVIFIANDRGRRGDLGRHGLYRIGKNGEVSKLAEPGDYFEGTGTRLTGLSGLRVDGERAVFRCGLDDDHEGVGMWENGRLLLLARTGDEEGLHNIGYPGYAGNTVTFYAEDAAEKPAVYAVDLASTARSPRKILDTTTPMPGRPFELFGGFGFQQEAEDGVAVIRGFAAGGRRILQDSSGRGHDLGGVYRWRIDGSGEPVELLDTVTPLPGGPEGATFAELQNATPRYGTVVVPSWTRDHSGLYYIGRDGTARLVADTNTRIPDLFAGAFTRFSKWAANCAPWVVFIAEAGSFRGLFAMHMERNELFLLLDNRTELGGRMVNDFELSSRPKLGEDFVLAIQFADESSGIYLLKFGDGWGKAIFRREAAESASERATEVSAAGEELVPGESKFSDEAPRDVPVPSAASLAAELVEEGSFRMIGNSRAHDAPDAATGKTNKVDEAELLQSGSVFAANRGLNFGFRYVLHSPGEDRCGVEGFEMFIVHPPIKGPDGQERTTSTIPMKVCFNDGKADDFLIYSLEEDYEVLPGSWTMQVRKDGEVLLSRSFTLL